MAYNVSLIFLVSLVAGVFVHDFMRDFLLDCKLISFWGRRDHCGLWFPSNLSDEGESGISCITVGN